MCFLGTKVVHEKKVRFCAPQCQELTSEEYDRHLAELRKEWSKVKPNSDHINVLLRDTCTNRRRWITSLPAGEFSRRIQ